MRITVAAVACCTALIFSACAGGQTDPTPSGGPSQSPSAIASSSTPAGTSTPANGSTRSGSPRSSSDSGGGGLTPGPPSIPGSSDALSGFDPRAVRLGLEDVASGLDQPVAITHAGDGTGMLYIVERTGRILVMSPDGTIAPDPLLDVSDRVDTQGERGLHYVAFHPEFESNGRFFVNYSGPDTVSSIVEYRRDREGTVPPASGRTLIRLEKPYWNHNGGWMGFGPDGYLYIALGDGGGDTPGDPFGNGQKRSELFGNILRIDVDGGDPYGIPSDNPYAGGGGGNARPEIWAYGLRNPWRASFDRETGDLWIGDVGQDTSEEVNVIPAGEGGLNFGWSDMEGFDCHGEPDCDPSSYVAPLVVYGTDQQGCAVSGGYVYRGSAYPILAGGYLFSDYCSGTIWAFDAEIARDSGSADLQRVTDTDLFIVSFGEDEAGELYVVDLGGTIQRVTAAAR